MNKDLIKASAFTVEVLVDKDGKQTYVVRTIQGQPVRVLSSSSELATFFDGVVNEMQDVNE